MHDGSEGSSPSEDLIAVEARFRYSPKLHGWYCAFALVSAWERLRVCGWAFGNAQRRRWEMCGLTSFLDDAGAEGRDVAGGDGGGGGFGP